MQAGVYLVSIRRPHGKWLANSQAEYFQLPSSLLQMANQRPFRPPPKNGFCSCHVTHVAAAVFPTGARQTMKTASSDEDLAFKQLLWLQPEPMSSAERAATIHFQAYTTCLPRFEHSAADAC